MSKDGITNYPFDGTNPLGYINRGLLTVPNYNAAPRMNKPKGSYRFWEDTLQPYLQRVASGEIAEQGLKRYGDAVSSAIQGDYSQFGEVAGDAIMGPFGGLLGTFGGKLAKTADLDMLKIAQEASERGMPESRIFDATGWFKGADGQWRFEIDDSASQYSPAAKNAESWDASDGIKMVGNNPNTSLLNHAILADAYPETKNIKSAGRGIFGTSEGAYKSPQYIGDPGLIEIKSQGANPHSTSLHELQHAIQQREGFARGGSPEMFSQQKDAELARDALNWAKEIRNKRKTMPNADISAVENALIKDYQDMGALDWLPSRNARDLAAQPYVLFHDKYPGHGYEDLENLVKLYRLDKQVSAPSNMELYKSLAGETEARNVQSRMGLLGDDRRMLPPWMTEDVPRDKQIVRFDGGQNMASITDFADSIKNKYGLDTFNVSESQGDIVLDRIAVPKENRGEGIGSKAVQDLIDYADSTGQRIRLTAEGFDGTSPVRLKNFYKKLGFVENKGRNKDFRFREGFYREPK